jgi:methylase of polypeptide subunit release factors
MSKNVHYLEWDHRQESYKYRWYSEAEQAPPEELILIDDTITANQALAHARQGIGMLWVGDYQNARNLLQALARRIDKPPRVGVKTKELLPIEKFHEHRTQQKMRADLLGKILIALNQDFQIELRRGQDVTLACREVLGKMNEGVVMPLKQLLAMVSSHEWRKKKVFISSIQAKITPHFGVFSPVRGEYLDLVMSTKLPNPCITAMDIGTGTGVLAIALAKRGIPNIIATDIDERAIACAQENISQLNLLEKIKLIKKDVFPEAKANLIVCNPPWLPAIPSSSIENAIFDPDSRFLKGFLLCAKNHLLENGQVWLILSDLAEHLGLRSRNDLLQWIANGGLTVQDKYDTKPKHPKVRDANDPLHFARSKEISSLWVLVAS